ncbi:MAG TPA: cytochrome c [Gammaproteobacteria bacterium]|nr:cytochrome c [Gammaproteobacteria bacterium]
MAGLLGLMLGGCGGGEEDSASGGGFLPPAGYVADAARGRALFQANCARCHGAGARGTGQGPPLLHPVYRPGHHADLAFYLAVRNGVQPHHWRFGPMPPVRGLDPEAVADIVAWVRQQQRMAAIQ